MLEKFERLRVTNDGSKRVFSLESIFINVNKIISLLDTDKMSEVLKTEKSRLSEEDFSILTWTHGKDIRESVVVGSAESISRSLSVSTPYEKELLNG